MDRRNRPAITFTRAAASLRCGGFSMRPLRPNHTGTGHETLTLFQPIIDGEECLMRVLSWLGGAAMAALVLAPQAQAQTNRYDGNWSVEVVTEQGACDRAYRYPVIVQNGQ